MTRDANFQLDYAGLISGIVTAGAQLLATMSGVTDGGSSALGALTAMVGAIRLDTGPGEKAFQLFCMSFAWAANEVLPAEKTGAKSMQSLVADVISGAGGAIESAGFVPTSFLERPTTLPMYILLRDSLIIDRVNSRSIPDADAKSLEARMDAAFNRAIFEAWARKPEVFDSIYAALNNPARQSAESERDWRSYRASIIYDFEVRPVFGQEQRKISLSQLHVPLRAQWKKDASDEELGSAIGAPSSTNEGANILLLEKEIVEWVDEGVDSDQIRLVGGGPGSGKSTSMRSIAHKLSGRDDIRVLFVPLQHLGLEGDLRDEINNYFVRRTGGAFRHPPLSRQSVEDGPSLVLIFDGLDELSRPGEAANEVARLFVTKLSQLISSLKGDASKRLRVIATGRMPSFQEVRRQIGCGGRKSLEVIGFGPVTGGAGSRSISAVDQRAIWWDNYSRAVLGKVNEPVPLALSDARLSGLTHEPLLCYLLALSGFLIGDWEAAAENRNRIYENLVGAVWERGWGDGSGPSRRRGPGKALTKANFFRLMETVALAAWLGGDARVATEAGFNEAVEILNTASAWGDFKRDSGEDVANLAMNFYLKASEAEHRGFEFTHKSFGEYLVSRALVGVAEGMSPLVSRRVDFAMQEWLRATRTGRVTVEILNFMRDEVRLKIGVAGADVISAAKLSFESIANAVIVDGFPAHGHGAQSWRAAEIAQKNAERSMWAILNACALGLRDYDADSDYLVNIFLPDREIMREVILRLSERDAVGDAFLQCLSCISAPMSDFFGLLLSEADFSYSNLKDANFSGAHVIGAKFIASNLEGVQFERAHLDSADFEDSIIVDADFEDARLREASFLRAKGPAFVNEMALLDLPRDFFVRSRDDIVVFKRYESHSREDFKLSSGRASQILQEIADRDGDPH